MTNHQDENDANLDRLLTHLGSAQTAAGFEQRILRAVERRRATVAPQSARGPLRAWGLASALALASLVAALYLSHPRYRAARALREVAQNSTQSKHEFSGAPVTSAPSLLRSRGRAMRRTLAVVPKEEPSAMLVSFPAPPMPLTEQEKLLVRLAHRGDPVEMAMLLPGTLEAQEVQRAAEYQEFFPPPAPPDNDPQPTNTKEKGDGR